ncbi:MAG: fatty acid desaturase, partial [Betaproteobacteria bacterium]|nr:fatty acid desaturase [Betaproteobacteria bacterium]
MDQEMPNRKIIRQWLLPLSERSTLRAFALLVLDTALFLG